MKQRSSEIFDLYASLAEDKGLVSLAEKEPTGGADEPPTTQMLYPQVYEAKILEQAHPEPVVVSPAYDLVNGLVENLEEQHKMMVDIAQKPAHGRLTEFLYFKAYQELNTALIKTAFDLDNKDQTELMILSDKIINQLEKKALAPLAIVGIITAALSLIGGLAYAEKTPTTQGLKNDAKKSIIELEEAISSYPQLNKSLSPLVQKLKLFESKIDSFQIRNEDIVSTALKLKGAVSDEEKKAAIANAAVSLVDGGKYDDILKEFNSFKELSYSLLQMIPLANDELMAADQKYGEHSSSIGKYLSDIWRTVVDSNAVDAAKQLAVFYQSLAQVASIVNKQISALQDLKVQVGSEKVTPKLESPKLLDKETQPTLPEKPTDKHLWL